MVFWQLEISNITELCPPSKQLLTTQKLKDTKYF